MIKKMILLVDDEHYNILALRVILKYSVGIHEADSFFDQALNG